MKTKKTSSIFMYILPVIVMSFNILIILFPKEIIGASKEGISLWFNNVLPSLLPFVIGANLLIGLGFVNFIGALVEPLMIKLFRVSGCGAFAWIIGMTSGYPMGAKITADLRQKNELTQAEAQRLISFVNNSGPLFVVGVVGTSMFKTTGGGYFMLLIHYLASFTTGLLFRNYKKNEFKKYHRNINQNVLKKALYELKAARNKDGRTFGALLSDSVKNSMETMVIIGGFIILFCVIVKTLEITNILGILTESVKIIGSRLLNDEKLYNGFIIGIIEITNGCTFLSEEASVSNLIMAAAVISWGGLSIHAQSVSFFSKTDIKISLYLFSKLIHFCITVIYGLLLHRFFDFTIDSNADTPVFNPNVFYKLADSSKIFLIVVILIILFGFLLNIRVRIKRRMSN